MRSFSRRVRRRVRRFDGHRNGNVANGSIIAEYHIDEVLTDGYKLKVTFKAESEANLEREITLSVFDAHPLFGEAEKENENVLASFDGSKLKNGDFKVDIQIKLSDYFDETETEKTFYIVLHDDSEVLGVTNCSSAEYKYTFKDGKVTINND